jgi:hypothetical protein
MTDISPHDPDKALRPPAATPAHEADAAPAWAEEAAAPQPAPPPSETPPSEPPPPRPAPRRSSALPVLGAIGFLLLAAGLAWVWNGQQQLAAAVAEARAPAPPGVDPARVAQLEAQVRALAQRPPPDLGPLEARVAALEKRPAAQPADLGPLTARIGSLESQVTQATQAADASATKAARAAALQAASASLEAGRPLGDIPGAPPAVARFASASPPTEASLRLSFPTAAARAEQASRPNTESQSLAERMWLHAQTLVTVTDGQKVIVGAPAAKVLGAARVQVDAGDLAGAVKTLAALDEPAAAAIADWRDQAQALLDARAGLAQMAATP